MAEDLQEDSGVVLAAHRLTSDFFKKYDVAECQELLANHGSHWLLSNDDIKCHVEPPVGLCTDLTHVQEHNCVFVIPQYKNTVPLDFREIHQIIRELTIGIYVLNQVPCLSLEANFDQSTTCLIPPAYQDTRVGQIMINVDYMMKSIWHGVYMTREKRNKFSERWRTNLDVNAKGEPETKKPLLTEFTSAGLLDITKDPDYQGCYEKIPHEEPGDIEQMDDKQFFMQYANNFSMTMTFYQKEISQWKNLFLIDSDWNVASGVRLPEDRLKEVDYERLANRLRPHQEAIRSHLENKAEIRHQLELLKFISFLVPCLIGMKKRMKIPDLSKMLPQMTGDECRTERELPPLILSNDFKCRNFAATNQYFHLHGGIQFDMDTPRVHTSPDFIQSQYKTLQQGSLGMWMKIMDPEQPLQDNYPVPVVDLDGKSYHVISIEFEQYFGVNPQRPRWVNAMCDEISKLKPERLKPLNDKSIHDIFKKQLGYRRSNKIKGSHAGLKMAIERNSMMVFQSFIRKTTGTARLNKSDDHGYTLMHHAALHNRPHAIGKLLIQNMDVNVRRSYNILSQEEEHKPNRTGVTPLHLAARVGALQTVGCLLGVAADPYLYDSHGWTPIHHAAFFNHEPCIKLLIRKHHKLLEKPTDNESKSTPLLLAATSGALDNVKTLIALKADIKQRDEQGNNMVNLAAMHFHTNVLEHLIQWDNAEIPVWKILVEMLSSDNVAQKESSVRCLEVLSTSGSENWQFILNAGGIPALVKTLDIDDNRLQTVAASALCNISEKEPIRFALSAANAGPILIKLLSSPIDDIQSRCAIILSDLACVQDNQNTIAAQNGIAPLVRLLDSDIEDVLVNAVNAVRVMCTDNKNNQLSMVENGVIEPLVEFLTVNSNILQAASSAAIAELVESNEENQNAVLDEEADKPIVQLINCHEKTVQVKAARALEALSRDNQRVQKAFLKLDAPAALQKLLKNWNTYIKEQGALALWALAGNTQPQQKYIAERIGFSQLLDMIMAKSEKLQFVGGLATISICRENFDNQNKICDEEGIMPLIRLLRNQSTSERVLEAVIKVLGALCIGVAHRNNKKTQRKIAEEGGIQLIVMQLKNVSSEEIQVEVASTLASVLLANSENQAILNDPEIDFNYSIILKLLKSKESSIRLGAGQALAIFAFNNTSQQFAIREAGGISYSVFKHFVEDEDYNVFETCRAAFQMVVLARVITDRDQVSLTAEGVTILVNVLNSPIDNAVILAASYMASLAHTRAGIPDAMVTSGAIDLLMPKLNSQDAQVRCACAVALGYLTFNKTAARYLLVSCRNTPGLYEKITKNIDKDAKISPEFQDDFKRACLVGLPALSLEINGGPPAIPPKREGKRPQTTMSLPNHCRSAIFRKSAARVASAPAMGRSQTYRYPFSGGQSVPLEKNPLTLGENATKRATSPRASPAMSHVSAKSKSTIAWSSKK